VNEILRKFYYAIMVLGAIFAATPGLQFALAILSGGLLFPVLFLPTMAYYGLALVPFLVPSHGHQAMLIKGGLTATILLAIVLLPSYLAEPYLENAKYTSLKIRDSLKKDRFDVLLQVPIANDEQIQCTEFCQFILAGENVASLKLTDTPRHPSSFRIFRIVEIAICNSAESNLNDENIRIEIVLADGRCIVSKPAPNDDAEVKLAFHNPIKGVSPDSDNKLNVYTRVAGKWDLQLEDVKGDVKSPSFPPWIGFEMSSGTVHGGSVFVSTKTPRNLYILKTIMGSREAAGRPPTGSSEDKPVSSLKLKGILVEQLTEMLPNSALSEKQHPVYSQFLDSLLVQRAANSESLVFLSELLRSDRIILGQKLKIVMSNNPLILNASVKLLVQEFTSACSVEVINLLSSVDTKTIELYSERLLPIPASTNQCQSDGALLLSGRLGPDPTSKLEETLSRAAAGSQRIAVRAMCISNTKWADKLKPLLLTLMPKHCDDSGNWNPQLEELLVALKNLGGEPEISAWLKSCSENSSKHFLRVLRRSNCF
jgi:hypothetical protein